MSSKKQKKGSRKKSNGKKNVKNVVEKSKHEIENFTKEAITELEKETFSIKISEMERKLSRKKQMCFHIEEEKNLYEALYKEKKVLKRESMKLLNNIYEEFANEIFLLEHELHAMDLSYEEILKGKEFCIDKKEQVRKLSYIESLLEQKLAEVEQGAKDIEELNSKLGALEDSVSVQERSFECASQHLIFQFNTFLKRIFEDLISAINEIIGDRSLKLEFLPSYYQALFVSGDIGTHWLNSTLEHCKMYLLQNQDIKQHFKTNYMKQSVEKDFRQNLSDISTSLQIEEFMNNWSKNLIVPAEEPKQLLETELFQNLQEQFIHIESKKKLAQSQNEIKVLKKKIENLEKIVNQQESCGKNIGENSQLALKVSVAVDIIKRKI